MRFAVLSFFLVLAPGCGRMQYDAVRDGAIGDSGLADAAVDGGLDAGPSDGGPGDAAVDGAVDAGGAPAARPLAPWSTAQASSLRPTFQFALAAGADSGRVELCRDPACVTRVATFDGPGSAAPPADIPRNLASTFFWRVTPMIAGAVAGAPSPMWTFTGRYYTEVGVLDTSFGSRLDVDADGFAEVAIGAPATGEVRMYAGSSAGASTTRTWTFTGPAGFGTALGSAGDVDGDGRAELLVGSPDGASFTLASIAPDDTPRTIPFPGAAGSRLGASVTTLGDANGDGYSDVAVGAPGEARVHLHYGSPAGLGSGTTIAGTGDFGAIVTAGDFDGDGFGDLAVAEPIAERVHVFFGSPSGIEGTARAVLTGTSGTRFGEAISGSGDASADGRCDLVVGMPGAGIARVYAGVAGGIETTERWTLDETTPGYGRVVAMIPDTDLNGYDDIVVAGDVGEALTLYFAQSRGVGTVPGWTTGIGVESGAVEFGSTVAGVHDVDGDRYTEVVVAAPGSDTAYLEFGAGGGLTRITPLTGAAGSRFGAAIAHP